MKLSHKKILILILILQLSNLLSGFNFFIEGNWTKVLFSVGVFISLLPISENIDSFNKTIFEANTSKVEKIQLLGNILIFSSLIILICF